MATDDLDQLVEKVLESAKYRAVGDAIVRHIGARELAARRNMREAIKATKNKLHQIGGAYLETRPPYEMWLNGARTKIAPTSKWKAEVTILMEKWPKEHNNGSRTLCSLDVHIFKLKAFRWDDFKVVLFIEPACLYADAFKHLKNAVHFFNACNTP